jgi:hypothetical protein
MFLDLTKKSNVQAEGCDHVNAHDISAAGESIISGWSSKIILKIGKNCSLREGRLLEIGPCQYFEPFAYILRIEIVHATRYPPIKNPDIALH